MQPKSIAPSIRTLSVDLSSGQVSRHLVEDRDAIGKFLGGRGYATYSLLKTLDPHIDADSAESPIVFAPGVLTGTSMPSSGRTSVIFKSPVTRRFFKTNVGGHFGAQLKFAGVDLLVVRGRAPRPSLLLIRDDNVEIRDASHLWGMDVRETNRLVRKELGDPEVQLACIGPAGENRVAFASIQASIYNSRRSRRRRSGHGREKPQGDRSHRLGRCRGGPAGPVSGCRPSSLEEDVSCLRRPAAVRLRNKRGHRADKCNPRIFR